MFANTNIRTLLPWGFGIIIALIVIMAAVIYQRSGVVSSQIADVNNDAYPKVTAAAAAHDLEALANGLTQSIGFFRT